MEDPEFNPARNTDCNRNAAFGARGKRSAVVGRGRDRRGPAAWAASCVIRDYVLGHVRLMVAKCNSPPNCGALDQLQFHPSGTHALWPCVLLAALQMGRGNGHGFWRFSCSGILRGVIALVLRPVGLVRAYPSVMAKWWHPLSCASWRAREQQIARFH